MDAADLGHFMLLHAIELATNEDYSRGQDNVIEFENESIQENLCKFLEKINRI